MVTALSTLANTEDGMSTMSSSLKSKWPLWPCTMPILAPTLSDAVV